MAVKSVFIFKAISSEDGKDQFAEELEKLDLKCTVIPVLHFDFCNLETLQAKLDKPELYSGIVFVSPRTVKAVAQCSPLKEEWKSLSIFAVGGGTEMCARNDLGLDAQGAQTGSAAKLAPFILQNQFELPLLIPCGNLSGDNLQQMLAEGGVTVDCVEVYKTNPHPELEENLKKALDGSQPDYILYFSPSGIDSTLPLFEKIGFNLDSTKWVAIGPTTEERLTERGIHVSGVAARPTPEHVAEAFINIMNDQNELIC